MATRSAAGRSGEPTSSSSGRSRPWSRSQSSRCVSARFIPAPRPRRRGRGGSLRAGARARGRDRPIRSGPGRARNGGARTGTAPRRHPLSERRGSPARSGRGRCARPGGTGRRGPPEFPRDTRRDRSRGCARSRTRCSRRGGCRSPLPARSRPGTPIRSWWTRRIRRSWRRSRGGSDGPAPPGPAARARLRARALPQAVEQALIERIDRTDRERDAMQDHRNVAAHLLEHCDRAPAAGEEVLADRLDPARGRRFREEAAVVLRAKPDAVPQVLARETHPRPGGPYFCAVATLPPFAVQSSELVSVTPWPLHPFWPLQALLALLHEPWPLHSLMPSHFTVLPAYAALFSFAHAAPEGKSEAPAEAWTAYLIDMCVAPESELTRTESASSAIRYTGIPRIQVHDPAVTRPHPRGHACMVRGVITSKHVFLHAPLIVSGFGM